VGWNEETKRLITNEANMIVRINDLKLSYLEVPKIIHFSNCDTKYFLVTSPIEGVGITGDSDALVQKVLETLALLAHETRADFQFMQSPFWKDLMDRIERIYDCVPTYQKVVLSKAIHVIAEHLGELTLPWTLKLGDVTRWNIALDEQNHHLKVVDLEYAREHWLVGWDIFRFLSTDYGFASDQQMALEFFREVGVDFTLSKVLELAYWVDLFTEWMAVWKNTNTPISQAAKHVFQQFSNKIFFITTKVLGV